MAIRGAGRARSTMGDYPDEDDEQQGGFDGTPDPYDLSGFDGVRQRLNQAARAAVQDRRASESAAPAVPVSTRIVPQDEIDADSTMQPLRRLSPAPPADPYAPLREAMARPIPRATPLPQAPVPSAPVDGTVSMVSGAGLSVRRPNGSSFTVQPTTQTQLFVNGQPVTSMAQIPEGAQIRATFGQNGVVMRIDATGR